MKTLSFHLSRGFNWVRWAVFVMVVSFVAVVGVYQYIDLSDSVAMTFSVFELVFILITDQFSISYIFLPMYLFIICGLSTQSSFGCLEVVRYKSRNQWMGYRWVVLLCYTIFFFLALFVLLFCIAQKAFPFQWAWSTDFLTFQVSLGQEVSNFTYPPLVSIGTSLMGSFFLYLFSGSVATICDVITKNQPLSLMVSLIVGVVASVLSTTVFFIQYNVFTKLLQCGCFLVLFIVMIVYSGGLVSNMDFHSPKKG